MPRRLAPRHAAKLAQVQHVRKAASEAALIAARDAEAVACSLRQAAQSDADAARTDWFEHLSGGMFEPERASHLATHSVAREMHVEAARTAFDEAATVHSHRQDDWRTASARVELADAANTEARRYAAKVRDERRLAEMSDRFTFRSIKP